MKSKVYSEVNAIIENVGEGPQPSCGKGPVLWKTVFPWTRGGGDGFGFTHCSPPVVEPRS